MFEYPRGSMYSHTWYTVAFEVLCTTLGPKYLICGYLDPLGTLGTKVKYLFAHVDQGTDC